MMEIIELLRDIGVFGLAMWTIQLLLSKSANRKFETYKVELDHKTREFQSLLDSKLELYKVEINLQNYKATKIYEQQLSIIIELHKKLTQLNETMALVLVAMMNSIIEKNEETTKAKIEHYAKFAVTYDDLQSFYKNNLLFIPTNTAEKIHSIMAEYSQSFTDNLKQDGTRNGISFEQVQLLFQKMMTEIKHAIDQLTLDFRKLLGVVEN